MAIDPAEVERRQEAHRRADLVPVFDGLCESRRSPHGDADEGMGLPFGPNGEIRHHEVPHVLHEVILIAAGVGVGEEGGEVEEGGSLQHAAVGGGENDGGNFAVHDGPVEFLGHVFEEQLLILAGAVEKNGQWIFLGRIKAGRQVDVEIAFDAERLDQMALIFAVIMGEVENLTLDAAVDACQFAAQEDAVGVCRLTGQG